MEMEQIYKKTEEVIDFMDNCVPNAKNRVNILHNLMDHKVALIKVHKGGISCLCGFIGAEHECKIVLKDVKLVFSMCKDCTDPNFIPLSVCDGELINNI